MRVWFPAAPDGTINHRDRAQFGLGISLGFNLDEPVVPVGPVLLTVRGAIASQALTVRGAGSSQALTVRSGPSRVVLTVREEVIT